MKTTFTGGALSFKGDKKTKTIKKKKANVKLHIKSKEDAELNLIAGNAATESVINTTIGDDDLTDAEKKAMKRKLEREKVELTSVVMKSHRERVEEFNEKLSSQTEHNDIPRVSAAGNG